MPPGYVDPLSFHVVALRQRLRALWPDLHYCYESAESVSARLDLNLYFPAQFANENENPLSMWEHLYWHHNVE